MTATPRLEVFKFGGTSVAGAERLRGVAALVEAGRARARIVVVSSAMSGVTDALLAVAAAAARGERDDALARVGALRAQHLEVAAALADDGEVYADVNALLDEVAELANASARLGEVSGRARDRIVATGEKLAVRLLARALRAHGLDALAVDADTCLETDATHGEAEPLGALADRSLRAALEPLLGSGRVPVVTGFVGRAPDGATTTLGRGGSDYTATLLAAGLGADEVTIWTDVPGVFSADPRAVPQARVIPQLHYREAAELSYYGAKVLHQRTMIPVASLKIPVWTRSTLEPELPGTVVDGRFTPGSHPVKAITAIKGQSLISIEGKGMSGVPGVAARVFGALAGEGISVTMISQSSSEASITLAVPAAEARRAESALKRVFRDELARGGVEEVVRRDAVALVACVGLGMAHTPGVAARIFGALGGARVNVLAIAQGSSELNISLAVDEREVAPALRALHAELGLDRRDTGVAEADGVDLLLFGLGAIGREVLRQLLAPDTAGLARLGLRARIVGVADRSGYLVQPGGIGDPAGISLHKAEGGRVIDLPGAVAGDAAAFVREALSWRLSRPVLIDCTDAGEAGEAWLEALRRGADVVTANKKPLAASFADYVALREAGAATGARLRNEATVGAGLPVIDTLDTLLATGDALHRAEGALSGTLGFLMTALGEGRRLSEAVEEAVALGYTEPDPVADLSGADVARKALILGRHSGLLAGDVPVALTGLVPDDWAGLPKPELFARLRGLDDAFAARVAAAQEAGRALRFVARVEPGRVEVGPMEVPASSPLGGLRGTDNLVVFTSQRYSSRPLVVSGPGAGAAVTAMGVLGDLFRLVAGR